MAIKPTFTGRKFKDYWTTAGDFKGTVLDVNKSPKKSKDGCDQYFINISVDGHPAYAVHDRWVEDDKQTTVNALAMLTTGAMESLGIPYTADEIADCEGVAGLIALWNTKGIVGRKVSYRIEERIGSNGTARLQKVKFL